MTSQKTQRSWEEIYNKSLEEYQTLPQTTDEEGRFAVFGVADALMEISEEDLSEYCTNDEDSSENRNEDNAVQHLQNPGVEQSTCSNFNTEHDKNTSRTFYVEDGNKIIFEKSGQTVNDVIEMIVAYHLRFGDSLEARRTLIGMFKICAGPHFKNLNWSDYKIFQVSDPPPEKLKFHFYCTQCMKKVLLSSDKRGIKGQSLCAICQAEHCMKLSNPNHFLTVDFEHVLRTLLENDEIAGFLILKVKNF
ncbi:uncharacterized protein LOC111674062 [Orussus abietinus]|uniref:uncharacterized protein LOC111674062 n=1 Tax=Orussus abietinus TaxID=222816 RepID=UPI000C715C60|nr:uncharacterized protein LOC111674062 [Orussus abietinus]